jgi:tetratricopeptide (TPR) repeat protein
VFAGHNFSMFNNASIAGVPRLLSLPVLLFSITALPCSTYAHAGIYEEIQALTLQIQQDPANPQGYVQRGELYRVHQDWDHALADFRKARQLDTTAAAAELGLGRTLLEQGSPQQALAHLNRALARQPGNVRALVTRARTYRALGEPLAAAADYSRAIGQFATPAKPLPEYYLERARAYAAAGDAYIGEALQSLDEGMQALGNIQTLARYGVELETGRGNFDAALLRLDPLIAHANRKEFLLFERGNILVAANRKQEARQDFLAAQAAIAALPPRHRQTRSVQQLETEISARLLSTAQQDNHEE